MKFVSQYFMDDIREYIVHSYRCLGQRYTSTEDLEDDLLKLFTVQKKFIHPFPRTVFMSEELKKKINGTCRYRDGILKLCEMLANGVDVNAHQSKDLFSPHVYDDLVYDWNIYHLHLKLTRTVYPYFTDRTKEVLFASIHRNQAYLIDFMEHSKNKKDVFADARLLEIMDNNWPQLLGDAAGIADLESHMNRSDRYIWRKSGFTEFVVKVNGRLIVSPGLGRRASMHSSEVVTKLDDFISWVKSFERALSSNRVRVDEILMSMHGIDNTPKYKLVFTEGGPQIRDVNTQRCVLEYRQEIRL